MNRKLKIILILVIIYLCISDCEGRTKKPKKEKKSKKKNKATTPVEPATTTVAPETTSAAEETTTSTTASSELTTGVSDASGDGTAPPPPPEGGSGAADEKPSETTSGLALCTTVVCNFESGSPCSYQNAPPDDHTKPWEVVQGKYKNMATGIRASNEGQYYLATYLKNNDTAKIESRGEFTKDLQVKFMYYKVADMIELKGCCDDSNCPFISEKKVIADHFNKWQSESFACPKGSNKVVFVARNAGANQGAVGIDDIQLAGTSDESNVC